MQRWFFIVAAVIGALLGLMMLFAPAFAAQSFGVATNPLAEALFRVLGAVLISVAILNFMVRDHPASPTLSAVVLMNVVVHALGAVADIWSTLLGSLSWSGIAPGLAVHAIVGIWAAYLLTQRRA